MGTDAEGKAGKDVLHTIMCISFVMAPCVCDNYLHMVVELVYFVMIGR